MESGAGVHGTWSLEELIDCPEIFYLIKFESYVIN